MFKNIRVFDEDELVGCAVHISGQDISEKYDRVFLVKACKGETMTLVNSEGALVYSRIESFNKKEKPLKMVILERPQLILERVQKQPEQLQMVQVVQDIPKEKRASRTKMKGRIIRTDAQIKAEEKEIELFLKKSEGRPIRLEKIVHVAKSQGWNWNNKNASSFMRSAIKNGAHIKKVGYGTYAYDAEVQS